MHEPHLQNIVLSFTSHVDSHMADSKKEPRLTTFASQNKTEI